VTVAFLKQNHWKNTKTG